MASNLARITYALVLGLLSACGAEGPAGPPGMQGAPGTQGPIGLPGNGSTTMCEPGRTFCDGAKIWSCTKSGTDAVLAMDCAADIGPASGNTTTNPYSCLTSSCPSDGSYGSHPGPACCRRTKYICVASFESDPSLDFSTYGPFGSSCGLGNGSGCFQTGVPVFFVKRTVGAGQIQVSLWLFPDKIKMGQVATLADLSSLPMECSGTQSVSVTAGGQTCTNWAGSVTWTSANPSFQVALDLSCQDADRSSMKLKGTFKGDV